jgi:glycosyltransferase involved in cell wall biosynthesis
VRTDQVQRCSIIISTYNRAPLLVHLFDALAAQQPAINAEAGIEIIVIDNNGTDDTASVVAAAVRKLPVRCVIESRQGLSHARNRGIAEATGDLLVFVDDDVRPDTRWLHGYLRAAANFADAGFFGGRIRPYWPQGRPGWVHDENMELLAGVFGSFDPGYETRAWQHGEPGPFGANFAVRRKLFDALGGFNPQFGRVGEDLGRGEESEFFLRARRAGHTGVYVGAAYCEHRVESIRLRIGALYRYGLASARAHRALVDAQAHGSLGGALGYLARGGLQLLKGRGDRFRQCVINAGIQMGLRD